MKREIIKKIKINNNFFLEYNISDELASIMTMPLMAPGAAQFARFMYNGQAKFSQFFIQGFERMTRELDDILLSSNKTVLQLFNDLAIE